MRKSKIQESIISKRFYLTISIIIISTMLISCAQDKKGESSSPAISTMPIQSADKVESTYSAIASAQKENNDKNEIKIDIKKIKEGKIDTLNSGEGHSNGNLSDLKDTIALNENISPDDFVKGFKLLKNYKLDEELERLKLKYKTEDNKLYGVKIERFDTELNNKPGVDIILEVSYDTGSYSEYTNYLIFISDGNYYKLVGNIEFVHTHYGNRPTYRIVNFGNDNIWLVVPQVTGSGTGLSLWEEMWYRIDGTIKEVARYPLRELNAASGEDLLHFDNVCDVLNVSLDDKGLCEILLQYYITFENGDYRLNAGGEITTAKLVTLIWDKQKSEFIFKKVADNQYFTQEGYDEFIKDGYSDNRFDLFIKEFYSELSDAATKEENKIWIRSILKECKDSPEKSKLLELLK